MIAYQNYNPHISSQNDLILSKESYESAYNSACYLIIIQEYTKAKEYLLYAIEHCIDIQEIQMFKAQLAHIKHLEGCNQDALDIYEDLKDCSKATRQIIEHNMFVLNQNDSQRYKQAVKSKKRMMPYQIKEVLKTLDMIRDKECNELKSRLNEQGMAVISAPKKRKKKSVSDGMADPERWLPKRERSGIPINTLSLKPNVDVKDYTTFNVDLIKVKQDSKTTNQPVRKDQKVKEKNNNNKKRLNE